MQTRRSLLFRVVPLLSSAPFWAAARAFGQETAAPDLSPDAVKRRIADGIELLNKIYRSPALGIWLDRPGDDMRAYYEGRMNPPWWSCANAVELLTDFMDAGGPEKYEAELEELYDRFVDNRDQAPAAVEELKRRGQWTEEDEARARRRGLRRRRATREGYRDFNNEYLDDSGWWGIAWLKLHVRTGKVKYLTTAKAVQSHMAAHRREDLGGGVVWNLEHERPVANAITNSLFLILSARLYKVTGEPDYLKAAEGARRWFQEQKLFDGSGVVDAPRHRGDYWTYNQGAHIGGLAALHEATDKAEYLDEAVTVAEAVLDRAGLFRDGVLFEKLGVNGWDPGLFKGICARYLGQLRDLLTKRKIRPDLAKKLDDRLRASAAAMIQNSVGPDGQYGIHWEGGKDGQIWNFNTHLSGLIALTALLPREA